MYRISYNVTFSHLVNYSYASRNNLGEPSFLDHLGVPSCFTTFFQQNNKLKSMYASKVNLFHQNDIIT